MNWLKRKLQEWLEIPTNVIHLPIEEDIQVKQEIQILPSKRAKQELKQEASQELFTPQEWRKIVE